MDANESFHNSHGIDSGKMGKDLMEFCFNCIACGEKYEIVDIETKSQMD